MLNFYSFDIKKISGGILANFMVTNHWDYQNIPKTEATFPGATVTDSIPCPLAACAPLPEKLCSKCQKNLLKNYQKNKWEINFSVIFTMI